MPVDPVSAPGALTAPIPRAPKQALDGDMFMSLLVTQLTNQDPSSPMDTTQMIAQTTQLAMMEKLTQIGQTTDETFSLQMRQAAVDMIGRQVSYTAQTGETVTGTATAVSYAQQVPAVTVEGISVPLNLIAGVLPRPIDNATT